MLLPTLWLNDYCDSGLDVGALEERLTMTGTYVERVYTHGVTALENFVVGRVLSAEPLLGEAAGEDHQMIGRDGPGNDLPHRAHRSAVTSVADSRRRSALSVCSQVKSGSWRPKCP